MSDTSRPGICIHGSLRRSCETCDLAERLDEAERERDEARAEIERLRAERDEALSDAAEMLTEEQRRHRETQRALIIAEVSR